MDLSFILLDALFKHYSIEESPNGTLKLYKYLYIKCGLALDTKKWTKFDLITFILSELNVQVFKEDSVAHVIYLGESFNVYSVGLDFIDNLEFRASMEGELDYKELMDSVYKKGYKNSSKFKALEEYKTHVKYNRLKELNSQLEVKLLDPMGIEGFESDQSHNPFKRTLEETLEAQISAEKFIGTKSTAYISEKDLEDYVVKNLSIFEEGLVCIGRQVEVTDGVIDLLAKDKNNDIVIIELKIHEAKSIVWQSIHYPAEIKDRYRAKKVRMITLAPDYSEGLLKPLKSLSYVEIYGYDIEVKGEIVGLTLKRY